MGSYPQEFIRMLAEAWRRGDSPFTELIKTYPAQEMDEAVKAVLDGSVVKAVLTWEYVEHAYNSGYSLVVNHKSTNPKVMYGRPDRMPRWCC
jgi:hypothetical protein